MVRPLDPNQLIPIANVACRSRLVFKDRTGSGRRFPTALRDPATSVRGPKR
jgi:hypothetical protein